MAKFKIGDHVVICGTATVLQTPLSDADGGWIVSPVVMQCRFWNEDEMTKETKDDNLVRRLYENDEANALTNEAARFIERQLKNTRQTKSDDDVRLNYRSSTPPEYR